MTRPDLLLCAAYHELQADDFCARAQKLRLANRRPQASRLSALATTHQRWARDLRTLAQATAILQVSPASSTSHV